MKPGDRLVVSFIEPHDIGETFQSWPMHITIWAWFRSDVTNNTLAESLYKETKDLGSFKAVVGPEEMFGGGRVLVNVIEQSEELQQLHAKVESVLSDLFVQQLSRRYPTYRPHVTIQKKERLYEGDTLQVEKISIVEQKGDHKEIVGEVYLG